MLVKYLERALEKAHYEIIDDPHPYYGEVPGLEGVWATGDTLEECRRYLLEAIEDWVFFSIAKGCIDVVKMIAAYRTERGESLGFNEVELTPHLQMTFAIPVEIG